MKKSLLLVITLFLGTIPVSLYAQRGQGQNGWGKNSAYCQRYDAKNIQEIKGKILKIEHFTPTKGMGYGIELSLETASGVRTVHLGPGWYVEKQEMKLQVGDQIEVKGSEIDFNGRKVLMAAEVERGKEEMKLRDETGKPMWW